MANCEQLAGELKVLEELLKQTSTEHKRPQSFRKISLLLPRLSTPCPKIGRW
jgi:hypothetical protein